jgi:hypothetical protein
MIDKLPWNASANEIVERLNEMIEEINLLNIEQSEQATFLAELDREVEALGDALSSPSEIDN